MSTRRARRSGRRRHPAQRIALMARLPAARFARTAAKTAGEARPLSQPVARRRFRTRRTVLIQPPTKRGVLRSKQRVLVAKRANLNAKRRHLAAKRLNRQFDFGRENHPYLDSHFSPAGHAKSNPAAKFVKTCGAKDLPSLGVTPAHKKAPNRLKSPARVHGPSRPIRRPRTGRGRRRCRPGSRVCRNGWRS